MNSPIKVLVVDDESLAREAITLRLQEFSAFEVCGEADNGSDAIVLARTALPDVIFLDIEMPETSGLVAAQTIAKTSDALIVFVSAYEHYALQAFRVNAIDYILKPIDDSLFNVMLDKIKQRLSESVFTSSNQILTLLNELQPEQTNHQAKYLQRIVVKNNNDAVMVNVTDIEYIISAKDYLCIKDKNTIHIHRCTMKQMEKLLDPQTFVRTHRSHIVNIKLITKVELGGSGRAVHTISEEKHPISRRYLEKVKDCIAQGKLT